MNEKLKANRASETEEQMKERLRREKDRARRIIQKIQEENKRSSETEDHEKQRLATLKRLKRCGDNELERKLRLEKVVARLAVEMEEERRARLEKMVATKRLRLAMETDEERKTRLEKMIPTTQLRLALETEEERSAFLIWIEIGVFISRNELARPVMGTIFLVYICMSVGLSTIVYGKPIQKNVQTRTCSKSVL